MKKTALILLVTVSIFPFCALAQDNLIRIIHDDGRVDEIEMPGNKKHVPPEMPADTATLPPASKDSPVAEDIAPVQAAPDPVERAIEKAVRETDKAPAPKVAAKPAKKKQQEAKKETPAESAPEGAISQYPASPEAIGRPMLEPEPRQIPPGTEITKEMALSIALDFAPPARSVTVLPRTHNGTPVFVVSFRTDDGIEDFLIDRQTGEPIWADGSRGAQTKAEPAPEAKPKKAKSKKKKAKKAKPKVDDKPKAEEKPKTDIEKAPAEKPAPKATEKKTEAAPATPVQALPGTQKPAAVSDPVKSAIEKAVNAAETKK
jgi:hypothetical protein